MAVARPVAASLVEVVVWLGTGSSGEGLLGAVLGLDGMDSAGRLRCVDLAKTTSRELVAVLVVLDAGFGLWIRGAGALVSCHTHMTLSARPPTLSAPNTVSSVSASFATTLPR